MEVAYYLSSLVVDDVAPALQVIAVRHLKAELKRANVTYEELAERLRKLALRKPKAGIANKLARATVPAHFFLASLAAIGCEAVQVENI